MTRLRFVSALYALLAVVQVCTAASSEWADSPPTGRRNSAQRDFALRAELEQLGKRLNTLEALAQESQAHPPAQAQPRRVPGSDEDEKSDSENDKLDFESQMELHIRDPRQPFAGIEGTLNGEKKDLIERIQAYAETRELHKVGGVLLYGPPGTGKTYFAEVLAARAGMRFLKIEAGEFDKGYAGDGAKRIKALVRCAQRNAPLLVFIDEIDIAGGERVKRNNDSAARSMNQTTSMLWRAAEIIQEDPRLLCIAASNRFNHSDEALKDRFDTRIGFGFPSAEQLDIAARHHCSEAGYQLSPQAQWPYQSLKWRLPRALWSTILLGYCRSSYNTTFRDIRSLIRKAVHRCDAEIRAAAKNGIHLEKIITQQHLDFAWKKVLAKKRGDVGINEKQEERLKWAIMAGISVLSLGTGRLSLSYQRAESRANKERFDRTCAYQERSLRLQEEGVALQRKNVALARKGLEQQKKNAKWGIGLGIAVPIVCTAALVGLRLSGVPV